MANTPARGGGPLWVSAAHKSALCLEVLQSMDGVGGGDNGNPWLFLDIAINGIDTRFSFSQETNTAASFEYKSFFSEKFQD